MKLKIKDFKSMKDRHTKELKDLPLFFAQNVEEYNKGMIEVLNLDPKDTDKIFMSGVYNHVFYKQSDSAKLTELLDRHSRELKESIDKDKKGTGFIYQMFIYSLYYWEYSTTKNIKDALKSLDLTNEDINNNKALKTGLNLAIKEIDKLGEY